MKKQVRGWVTWQRNRRPNCERHGHVRRGLVVEILHRHRGHIGGNDAQLIVVTFINLQKYDKNRITRKNSKVNRPLSPYTCSHKIYSCHVRYSYTSSSNDVMFARHCSTKRHIKRQRDLPRRMWCLHCQFCRTRFSRLSAETPMLDSSQTSSWCLVEARAHPTGCLYNKISNQQMLWWESC